MLRVLLLCFWPLLVAAAATKRSEPAPLLKPHGEVIPDRYIVKLKEDISISAFSRALSTATESFDHVYSRAFKGFAGKLDHVSLQLLRDNSDVDFIEHDGVVNLNGYVEQPGASWGLVRISHRRTGSISYVYDDSAGQGACTYVIDTGVDDRHPEFSGRAHQIKTFVNETTDGNGHGTYIAGIIGSKSYGVAKKATIYGVKVLDNIGSGSYSNIIAGMDFVSRDAKQRKCTKGAMANLSLGGSFSASINNAAAALVRSGVFVSVSAGGENSDAARFSPASEPSVCTAGATTSSDSRSSSSNYGSVIDIFAPGANIKSTWLNGGSNTLSGSSASAAHITGLGAYLAALEGFPGAQELCKRIQYLATRNLLINIPSGTQNLLAFNGNPSG